MVTRDCIDDLLSKLRPIIGEKAADALWMLYHADNRERAFVESLARLMSARHLDETYERKTILLPPIPKERAAGNYPLGIVFYGERPLYLFGLTEDEWIRHVAIFGRSGSGKTMVAFIILANLLKHGKPFLVFDWKRNYRDLFAIEKDILVFTIGREISPFFWNPLIPPPGILPSTWIRKLVEILCHAYFLGEGVTYLLVKAIDSVFTQHGIYEGSCSYPTFADVFRHIERYKATGRERQWLDSAKRTLAVLCFGEFGKALNVKSPPLISELLKKNVIMELDALPNSDKTFFIEALLLWIHHYRIGRPEREIFKHAILIEEAHHILLRKKQELFGEEAITDVILREIRELGESIILIDQHPSLISKPALGNTYTTIAMNLKHGSDVTAMADSMLLDSDQKDYLGELPIGAAIVKMQGRWFKPFLVKFPYLSIKKGGVTDFDIKQKMRSYSEKLGQVRPEKKILGVIRDFLPADKKKKLRMSMGEISLMKDIAQHPLSGIVERYKRLGLSSYQGNKLKNDLIQKGLIKETSINTKKGRIKVLRLNQSAAQALKSNLSRNSIGRGNPGIEHEYWKKKIAEHFRKLGYEVREEMTFGNGKSVDIAAKCEKETIAIEVETGKSDAIYNIKKDLDAGFDRVLSIALDSETKKKILHDLQAFGLISNRVKIAQVREILKI